MQTGYRWPLISLLTLTLATTSLVGCRKDKAQTDSAKTTVKMSPAEQKKLAESAKRNLEDLSAPVGVLRARVTELHKEFDPLPPGLPGFGETRSEFYTTAEGIGMMSQKLIWMSERLDTAVKASDGEELTAVSKDIEKTYTEVKTADQLLTALIHKVQPFKKAREVLVEDVIKQGDKCEPPAASSAASASPAAPRPATKSPKPR